MNPPEPHDVTGLLLAWQDGNDQALDELIPVVYTELRSLARRQLGGERQGHSLQPTALTHEAFLRLFGTRQVGWKDRAHFFAVASQLMRRVLVEHARKRDTAKRGGDVSRVAFDDEEPAVEPLNVDIVALNEVLDRLEALDPRQSRIVELKYFGGLSTEEAAEVLGISPATVTRDWRVARLWLRRELGGEDHA